MRLIFELLFWTSVFKSWLNQSRTQYIYYLILRTAWPESIVLVCLYSRFLSNKDGSGVLD